MVLLTALQTALTAALLSEPHWAPVGYALKLQLLWKGWRGFLNPNIERGGLNRGVFSGMTAALLSSVGNRLWYTSG